jgi:hypothetical protein
MDRESEVPVIGLVACCKTKLAHRAPARELYAGTLFKLARAYVERRCEGWAILSAKHGLLLPGQEIEPYEQTLVGAPWSEVQAWHRRVHESLELRFPGAEFLVIAGHEYMGAVVGLPFTNAFGGLPIGRKMQAIKAALGERSVTKV